MKISYKILASGLIGLLVSTTPLICAPRKSITPQKNFNPATTLIATDIDEVVIFGREPGSLLWFAHPYRVGFGLKMRKARNKYHLHDAYAIIDKVVEHNPTYAKLGEQYKARLISGTVNKGTITILSSLQQQGFTVLPASNITKSVYRALVTNNVLPKTLFTTQNYFVKTKKCNKRSNGDYYKKPSLEYYKNLQAYIQKKYPGRFENIIFIDDKKANVKGARKVGITAIHFKNPEQVKRKLQKLGIAVL